MKKYILYFATVILLSSSWKIDNKMNFKDSTEYLSNNFTTSRFSTCIKKNDLSKMNLNGRVKSIIELSLDKSKKQSNENEQIIDKYIYKFYANGYLREVHHWTTKEESFFHNFKKIITYDYNWMKRTFDYYNLNGQKIGQGFYTYDPNGNELSEVWCNFLKKPVVVKRSKYIDNKISADSTYDSNNILIDKYKYDKNGNKIEYIYRVMNEINTKQLMSYDKNNNEINITFFIENMLLTKWDVKYIKFDSHGNWVKKHYYEDSSLIQEITREISYY